MSLLAGQKNLGVCPRPCAACTLLQNCGWPRASATSYVLLVLEKAVTTNAGCVQKAEDGPYLVKFLLHGSNGTPLRDMLRSVSRNLKHPHAALQVQRGTSLHRGAMQLHEGECRAVSTHCMSPQRIRWTLPIMLYG